MYELLPYTLLVPIFVSILNVCFIAMVRLLFYNLITGATDVFDQLDAFILKNGTFVSGKQLSGRLKPALGLHIFKYKSQWILAWKYNVETDRSTPFYHLYSLSSLDHLYNFQEKSGTMEMWFEPTSHDWQLIRPMKMTVMLPQNGAVIYPHQQKVVDTLIYDYENNSSHNVSAIIKGPTRTGKSTTARYLAEQMKTRKYFPIVVTGFNPTIPGLVLSLLNSEFDRTEQSPMILVLDEYDSLIKAAATGDTSKDIKSAEKERPMSYAHNKATILSFLDRLAALPYIIIIATTNIPEYPSDSDVLAPFYNSARLKYKYDFSP